MADIQTFYCKKPGKAISEFSDISILMIKKFIICMLTFIYLRLGRKGRKLVNAFLQIIIVTALFTYSLIIEHFTL